MLAFVFPLYEICCGSYVVRKCDDDDGDDDDDGRHGHGRGDGDGGGDGDSERGPTLR